MGHVYRETYTKPLPEGATISEKKIKGAIQRIATWKDKAGKTRTAAVTIPDAGPNAGQPRVIIESATYTAKYRDSQGVIHKEATGCKDKSAAQAVLARIQRRVELTRAGLLSHAEDAARKHTDTPLTKHIDEFEAHLIAKGDTAKHAAKTARYLTRMVDACGFAKLRDLDRGAVEQFLSGMARDGDSARVRNGFRVAALSFGNWLVRGRRLFANPFEGMPRANEQADPRRPRRAFTEKELTALLTAARQRPMQERLDRNAGDIEKIPERDRRELELRGLERATAYKLMAFTGLRLNEAASLRIGALILDSDQPHVKLEAAKAKNRKTAHVALRRDVVDDLRAYLAARLKWQQEASGAWPAPIKLEGSALLFAEMPTVRVLDRDLLAAGLATKEQVNKTTIRIHKVDDNGQSLDMHSLRHTFATMLGRSGVSLQVAQTAMRHSDPKLTATTYTHLGLIDVQAALDTLPAMPLHEAEPAKEVATVRAGDSDSLVPLLVPTSRKTPQNLSKSDKIGSSFPPTKATRRNAKTPVFTGVSANSSKWAQKDSNLRPSDYESPDLPPQVAQSKDLQDSLSPACTSACTGDPVKAALDALANLTDEQRAAVAEALQPKKTE